jgi:hypothetical protein
MQTQDPAASAEFGTDPAPASPPAPCSPYPIQLLLQLPLPSPAYESQSKAACSLPPRVTGVRGRRASSCLGYTCARCTLIRCSLARAMPAIAHCRAPDASPPAPPLLHPLPAQSTIRGHRVAGSIAQPSSSAAMVVGKTSMCLPGRCRGVPVRKGLLLHALPIEGIQNQKL